VRRGQAAPGAHVQTSVVRPRAVRGRRAPGVTFSAYCDELDEDEPVSYAGFAVTHSSVSAPFSS